MARGREACVASLQEGDKLLIPGDVVDREHPPIAAGRLVKVFLPLALVAAIAVVGLRWSKLTGRPDKAELANALGFAGVEAGQIIPVKQECTLFTDITDWTPRGLVKPGWSVLTGGFISSDHQNVPVQEVRDERARKVAGLSGAVQTSCLQLPARSGVGGGSDSNSSTMATVGTAPPTPDVPTTPEAPTRIRHQGDSLHSAPELSAAQQGSFDGCGEVLTKGGYMFCKNAYCGQDAKIETGSVANPWDCMRLCDTVPNCFAVEIFGRDQTECTLRHACDHPIVSTVGTTIGFKVGGFVLRTARAQP